MCKHIQQKRAEARQLNGYVTNNSSENTSFDSDYHI